jgi:adenosylcobinamide kinase/adenosylcobinamide-phosphate guanylyltransferase
MSAIHLPKHGPFSLLALGGARSGKSAYGEGLVAASAARHVYLATAEAHDGEMAVRIAHHRSRRGERWRTIEEPLAIADILRNEVGGGDAVLVDCLTLWLSNLMGAEWNVQTATDDLLDAISVCKAGIVFISNEVGWGIVPDNEMARRFRDEAGRMHQRIAGQADGVVAVMAGLPLVLKAPLAQS